MPNWHFIKNILKTGQKLNGDITTDFINKCKRTIRRFYEFNIKTKNQRKIVLIWMN